MLLGAGAVGVWKVIIPNLNDLAELSLQFEFSLPDVYGSRGHVLSSDRMLYSSWESQWGGLHEVYGIDFSSRRQLPVIAEIPTSGPVLGVVIADDYLYATAGNHLQVFDPVQHGDPTPIGELELLDPGAGAAGDLVAEGDISSSTLRTRRPRLPVEPWTWVGAFTT